MATDMPAKSHHDRHETSAAEAPAPAGTGNGITISPAAKTRDKQDGVDKKTKPPKPSKPEGAAGKARKPKRPGVVDRIKAAATSVADAAATPRGRAIGAVAAAAGVIAGIVALAGPRRVAPATKGVAEPRDTTMAGQPAETIGAIMAKTAEQSAT